jgi:hypothetical protein
LWPPGGAAAGHGLPGAGREGGQLPQPGGPLQSAARLPPGQRRELPLLAGGGGLAGLGHRSEQDIKNGSKMLSSHYWLIFIISFDDLSVFRGACAIPEGTPLRFYFPVIQVTSTKKQSPAIFFIDTLQAAVVD